VKPTRGERRERLRRKAKARMPKHGAGLRRVAAALFVAGWPIRGRHVAHGGEVVLTDEEKRILVAGAVDAINSPWNMVPGAVQSFVATLAAKLGITPEEAGALVNAEILARRAAK